MRIMRGKLSAVSIGGGNLFSSTARSYLGEGSSSSLLGEVFGRKHPPLSRIQDQIKMLIFPDGKRSSSRAKEHCCSWAKKV